VWWIRQSILQAIAEKSRMVRLPLNQVGALNKIKKSSSLLEQQLERTPSDEELAEFMDLSFDKVKETMHIGYKPVSMDAPLIQDEDLNLIDVYVEEDAKSTDDSMMKESLTTEVSMLLSGLNERERSILYQFFGIGMAHGMTLEEIAISQNLTRERVRQIKERALKRIRESEQCKKLAAYLNE
jgi:RNA polymerase primary sigma factor